MPRIGDSAHTADQLTVDVFSQSKVFTLSIVLNVYFSVSVFRCRLIKISNSLSVDDLFLNYRGADVGESQAGLSTTLGIGM